MPVNPWRISTRLSKSITWAMSFDFELVDEVRRRRLQRADVLLHARAAVEQQRQRYRRWRLEKNVTFCLMPSSNTEEVASSRSVM